jgi:hypothetical protein
MALAQTEIDLAVERLKSGAAPNAVMAELFDRGASEAQARETVEGLVRMKLEVDARAAVVELIRKGYEWEGVERAVRGKGLSKEQEDAILAEAQPVHAKEKAAQAARDLKAASDMRELAKIRAESDRRQKVMWYGQLGLGVFLLLAGIALSVASALNPVGRTSFLFTGLIAAGLGILVRGWVYGRPE